jgi:hypothetical protein
MWYRFGRAHILCVAAAPPPRCGIDTSNWHLDVRTGPVCRDGLRRVMAAEDDDVSCDGSCRELRLRRERGSPIVHCSISRTVKPIAPAGSIPATRPSPQLLRSMAQFPHRQGIQAHVRKAGLEPLSYRPRSRRLGTKGSSTRHGSRSIDRQGVLDTDLAR